MGRLRLGVNHSRSLNGAITLRIQLHLGIVLVSRVNLDEAFERSTKQLEQILQFLGLPHEPNALKIQHIGAIREISAEPAFIVPDFEMNLRLTIREFFQFGIGQQLPDFDLLIPFDNERVIKVGITNIFILHSKELAHGGEETLTVDLEIETVFVDKAIWRSAAELEVVPLLLVTA